MVLTRSRYMKTYSQNCVTNTEETIQSQDFTTIKITQTQKGCQIWREPIHREEYKTHHRFSEDAFSLCNYVTNKQTKRKSEETEANPAFYPYKATCRKLNTSIWIVQAQVHPDQRQKKRSLQNKPFSPVWKKSNLKQKSKVKDDLTCVQ